MKKKIAKNAIDKVQQSLKMVAAFSECQFERVNQLLPFLLVEGIIYANRADLAPEHMDFNLGRIIGKYLLTS